MVTSDHFCPCGNKAKYFLERNNGEIEDLHLESMDANRAFKKENGYDETPQIFHEGDSIGNYGTRRRVRCHGRRHQNLIQSQNRLLRRSQAFAETSLRP